MVVAPGFEYDEVGMQRKMDGVGAVIEGWQGWATAVPDAKATFENALVQGTSVVLEVTWRGTHTGPLQSRDSLPRSPRCWRLLHISLTARGNDRPATIPGATVTQEREGAE